MSLRDYLQSRRSEIEAGIKALRAELAEISVAEAALNAAAQGQPAPVPESRPVGKLRAGSIKDWIMRVLRENQDGLETDDVIAAVKAAGGPDVPRSSMTPQLSRLKAAGMIYQQGRRWCVDLLFDGFDNGVDLDEPEIIEPAPQLVSSLQATVVARPPWLLSNKDNLEDIL